MKCVLLMLATIVMSFLLFLFSSLAPIDVSGQILYPATAYPPFVPPPVSEAYPAYATPKPTLIPTAPPDILPTIFNPVQSGRAYLHVTSPEQNIEQDIEPTQDALVYRIGLCQRYPVLCVGRRHLSLTAQWQPE